MQVAPVTIGRFETQPAYDGLGLQTAIECDATLTGYFGVAGVQEVTVQLVGRVIQIESGGAGILQADHVGILCLQPTEQPPLGRSLNTIHVHTDDPHKWPPKSRVCMIPELKRFS
ncbi:hypothetical protein D3C81_1425540 [compost metagenome]